MFIFGILIVLSSFVAATEKVPVMASRTTSDPRRTTGGHKIVEETISYYQSPEKKRQALRRALRTRPDDPRLQQHLQRLIEPRQIQIAAEAGIFMSYSRADELFVLDLADQLRTLGVNLWVDMLDVTPEGDWNREVRRALEASGLMLAVLSPDALHDAAAHTERDNFLESGKLVQSVIARRSDLSGMDFWLPPIDFSRDFQVGLHQLLRVLSVSVL